MKAATPEPWFVDDEHGYHVFRVTPTNCDNVSVNGYVEAINGWLGDGSKTPLEFEHYLTFCIKWDGCSHVYFGDKEGEGFNGYLHLCGAFCWRNHIVLMAALFNWAAKAIPFPDHELAGTLPEPFPKITPSSS